MKVLPKVLLCCCLFLLSACASNEPSVTTDYATDVDFSRWQSYRWYGDVFPSKEEEFRSYNDSYQRIRAAVDDYLTTRGYREAVGDGADFFVNYHVSTHNNVKIDNFARYSGDGGVHGGVSTGTYGSSVAIGYSSPNHGVRTYKEGTAVIDIIESASKRVAWRGVAEGRMSKDVDLSKRRRVTREVVEMLLGQFPPQP